MNTIGIFFCDKCQCHVVFLGDWALPADDGAQPTDVAMYTAGDGGDPGDSDEEDEDDDEEEEDEEDIDEEEESEEENEMVVLDPDHPLMKRFQDALNRHLTQQNEKVTLELKELVCIQSSSLYAKCTLYMKGLYQSYWFVILASESQE